jgi:hypothetical protein
MPGLGDDQAGTACQVCVGRYDESGSCSIPNETCKFILLGYVKYAYLDDVKGFVSMSNEQTNSANHPGRMTVYTSVFGVWLAARRTTVSIVATPAF